MFKEMSMATGTVKWFNNQKGFGFICPEGGGEDIFAHFSSIVMEGYKSLKAGQKVYYELNDGPKGLHAMNIRESESMPSKENT
jgi:CspA family cold shock protein